MGENTLTVSDDSFESEVISSEMPVLIDFWASWCGPCKAIAPIVEEIASAYKGKIKVAKLNVDDNPKTPAKFGVRGIPTLIMFKDGQAVDQVVGAIPKSQLDEMVKKVL